MAVGSGECAMTKEAKPNTHLVAIVKIVDHYYNYGDDYDTVAHSISEWEEVDEEAFQLLKNASTYQTNYRDDNRFIVLERLSVDSPVVVNTVSAYVKYLAKAKDDKEKAEKDRKAKAEERRLKKLAKDEKARLELYTKLQAEFGDKK